MLKNSESSCDGRTKQDWNPKQVKRHKGRNRGASSSAAARGALSKIIDKHSRDLGLARLPLHENQCVYWPTKSCEQAIMSLLGKQRLPMCTNKLHWLRFWTLRALLIVRPSCQWSGLCKTWSLANAHRVHRLHAKQQLMYLQYKGDGGRR
ncbi:hypothetical protein Trydic_g7398 [Trypoxylus dichotomus]